MTRTFFVSAPLVVGGLALLMPGDWSDSTSATEAVAFGPLPLAVAGMVGVLYARTRTVVAALVLALAGLFVVLRFGPADMSLDGASAFVFLAVWVSVFLVPTARLTAWMIAVIRRLRRAGEVAADLAVAEERLRFSRDLHDVFGRTLSSVAVKSELAAELARRGDDRAVAEMTAVRELAQTALSDVRGLVRGYRRIDLADEVAGARTLLRAAGIRVRTHGLDDPRDAAVRLPERTAEALAWVVREGVTNVLRHGQGTDVELSLVTRAEAVELVIENARPRGGITAEPGTGLIGLRERVHAVGGSLEAGPHGPVFRLVARVPVTSLDR